MPWGLTFVALRCWLWTRRGTKRLSNPGRCHWSTARTAVDRPAPHSSPPSPRSLCPGAGLSRMRTAPQTRGLGPPTRPHVSLLPSGGRRTRIGHAPQADRPLLLRFRRPARAISCWWAILGLTQCGGEFSTPALSSGNRALTCESVLTSRVTGSDKRGRNVLSYSSYVPRYPTLEGTQ